MKPEFILIPTEANLYKQPSFFFIFAYDYPMILLLLYFCLVLFSATNKIFLAAGEKKTVDEREKTR